MGGCISQVPTVQHADNDNAVELTRVSHLERNPASEQNTNEQQHQIECLKERIQQLEAEVTRVKERMLHGEEQRACEKKQIEELEKKVVDLKAESENKTRKLAALQSELERRPTSTYNIQHVDTVHASDTATHAKTLTTYTSSEMLVDNSQTVNSTEEHISVNENTETRTDSTDQIPKPRPDWKL
ncbi:uncharacterized protein LOC110457101 [Mizuhopecten yessoensis]|uniref:Uncharacterized protein n=1 Tax=Mizuhopecten yessoensis TaxID=6573 RepID=A0A210Q9H0_MIZYE|nr:uncharacterized protein LOC110457101 [Mizuhopecten yessoensis]OWF45392.1 hypothetical protein KP79_PYT19328 [Mizuhopecten yessoensis]